MTEIQFYFNLDHLLSIRIGLSCSPVLCAIACLPTFLMSAHHLLQGHLTSAVFFPPTLWRRKCSGCGLPCGWFFYLLLIITCSFLEETKQRSEDEVCVGYLFNGLNVRLFVSYTGSTSSSLAPSFRSPGDTHEVRKEK